MTTAIVFTITLIVSAIILFFLVERITHGSRIQSRKEGKYRVRVFSKKGDYTVLFYRFGVFPVIHGSGISEYHVGDVIQRQLEKLDEEGKL